MLKVKKLNIDAHLPEYATEGSAGMDFKALHNYDIYPGDNPVAVQTGIAVELPPGYEMRIQPRSGLSLLHPNYISNSPGCIDADYRGEVCILVVNKGWDLWRIKAGDKIAQGIVSKVKRCVIREVEELSMTERGDGGMGSTG